MAEDLKKTAEAYGTVSEEKATQEAKDTEKVTEKMMKKESEKEEKKREKEIENLEEIENEKSEEKSEEEKFKEKLSEEKKKIYENWEPKTKLGKEVKNNKIKNIDEILEQNKKILEIEIVDY